MALRSTSPRDKAFLKHPAATRGFTVLEVVVVLGIFTLLIGVGLFMSMETFRGSMYRSESSFIVSLMQRARSRAMANIDQSAWGICYLDSSYVIFKGTVCISSAVTDRVEANEAIATASDFAHKFPRPVFTQLSGTTTATSTAVIQNSHTSTISINDEGTSIW